MGLNFPDSPTLNQIYADTVSGFSYQWDGTVWQSYTASTSKNINIVDDISSSFNGSTQTFALTVSSVALTPANAQQLRVVLGGIVQEPLTDYTISGSDITFTTAPNAGLDCSIVSFGPAIPLSVAIIGDGSVTPAKLSTGGPYWNSGGDLSVSGIITATSFVGDGSGITGISSVSFAATSFGLSGTPNITVAIATASSFVGDLTGTATGLSGTPNITVGVLTASSTSITGNVTVGGNVSIAGTLTYEDVTNVDSIGVVTARSGVVVVGGGISVTSGVSTISGGLDLSNLLREGVNIVAGKLSDNPNINVDNGMVHFFTTTETTTSTPNITSSVGINTQMAVGETSAVTIITTAAAAGYSTCINIDGSYNDVKWLGGADPSTGGSSGNDVYSLQIIKTASATYTVLGSVNNFA